MPATTVEAAQRCLVSLRCRAALWSVALLPVSAAVLVAAVGDGVALVAHILTRAHGGLTLAACRQAAGAERSSAAASARTERR